MPDIFSALFFGIVRIFLRFGKGEQLGTVQCMITGHDEGHGHRDHIVVHPVDVKHFKRHEQRSKRTVGHAAEYGDHAAGNGYIG